MQCSHLSTVTTDLQLLNEEQYCPGENVIYQYLCTVGGDLITWVTPEGEISRHLQYNGPNDWQDEYHIEILEQNPDNTTSSILTFSSVTNKQIGCKNETEDTPIFLQAPVQGIELAIASY